MDLFSILHRRKRILQAFEVIAEGGQHSVGLFKNNGLVMPHNTNVHKNLTIFMYICTAAEESSPADALILVK